MTGLVDEFLDLFGIGTGNPSAKLDGEAAKRELASLAKAAMDEDDEYVYSNRISIKNPGKEFGYLTAYELWAILGGHSEGRNDANDWHIIRTLRNLSSIYGYDFVSDLNAAYASISGSVGHQNPDSPPTGMKEYHDGDFSFSKNFASDLIDSTGDVQEAMRTALAKTLRIAVPYIAIGAVGIIAVSVATNSMVNKLR